MSTAINLLDIQSYTGEGYKPLIDYQSWRVAILNYKDDSRVENISNMQRHNETDEVFVLLRGRCILFVGAGNEHVTEVYAEDLEPYKLYNVRRGVWHHHALSPDASVLIVENRETTLDNSPHASLDTAQRAKLVELTHQFWK